MKVLHIVNWYPNSKNPYEALWIRNHIHSLPDEVECEILHFEIFIERSLNIKTEKKGNLNQLLVTLPFTNWFLFELIHFLWLFYQLVLKKKAKGADVINFHIAYPMLTYWHWIKKKVDKPIIITEHWSAYHLNFGVSNDLPRIQNIFRQSIPVITVSKALHSDIQDFAKCEFPHYFLPNIVNSTIFHPGNNERRKRFLMVSTWKHPKRPFLAIEAFMKFREKNPDWDLIIVGEGGLYRELMEWKKEKDIDGAVHLLGNKKANEIAELMRSSSAFLHPSDYETFSVVCAEARACGLPILASNRGGISEVIGKGGIVIENTKLEWQKGIESIAEFNLPKMHETNPFKVSIVGEQYLRILNKIAEESATP